MKKVLMILLGIALVFSMTGVVMAEDGIAATAEEAEEDGTLRGDVDTATNHLKYESGSGKIDVKYNVLTERYTLKYPTQIIFPQGAADAVVIGKVNITSITLAANRMVEVNLTTTNGFNLVSGTDSVAYTLAYTLKDDSDEYPHKLSGNDKADDGSLVDYKGTQFTIIRLYSGELANDPDAEVDLKFNLAEPPTGLGYYQDTLHFTVYVKTITPPVDPEQGEQEESAA